MNEKVRDTEREINDWLTGRGQIGVWVILAILAVAAVVFVVMGLLA